MPMPDFSFLANRQPDRSLESLASNFMQAFQMASQARNQREALKLQQEQMQQEYAQKQTEYAFKMNEYAMKARADQVRDSIINKVREETDSIQDPAERLRSQAMEYNRYGLVEEAEKTAKAYKDLWGGENKDKNLQTIKIDTQIGDAPAVRLAVEQPDDPEYSDELNEEFGIPKGFKVGPAGPKMKPYDPLAGTSSRNAVPLAKVREELPILANTKDKLESMWVNQEGASAVPPGFGGAVTFVTRMADAIGASIPGADKWTASESSVKAAAAELMKLFGGSDTEREFGWTLETLPSLLQDEVGRTRVMNDLLKLTNRKIETNRVQEQFLIDESSGRTKKTLNETLMEYKKSNPLRKAESPLKQRLIESGRLNADVAAEAERRLAAAIKADPKNKDKYISNFIKQTHYVPQGY